MAARRRTRGELERYVSDVARLNCWWHHRGDASAGSPSGAPDGFPTEALVRGEQLMLAFLTSSQRALTPLQRRWLEALSCVRAVDVYVFSVEDFAAVTRVLQRGRVDAAKQGRR